MRLRTHIIGGSGTPSIFPLPSRPTPLPILPGKGRVRTPRQPFELIKFSAINKFHPFVLPRCSKVCVFSPGSDAFLLISQKGWIKMYHLIGRSFVVFLFHWDKCHQGRTLQCSPLYLPCLECGTPKVLNKYLRNKCVSDGPNSYILNFCR